MTIQENFDFIDDFLSRCEDWMHGDDGEDCTKSRKYLAQIKETFL